MRALAIRQSEITLSTALINQTLVLCLEKIAKIASIVQGMTLKLRNDIKGTPTFFCWILHGGDRSWVPVRSIHLEIVMSLSVEALIHALQKFMNRPGVPQLCISDHGTNFVAAPKWVREKNLERK